MGSAHFGPALALPLASPTLNQTTTPCCSRLPDPSPSHIGGIFPLWSLNLFSHILLDRLRMFPSFRASVREQRRGRDSRVTSRRGKVLCKICPGRYPNLHKGFSGGLMSPPEPWEAEAPGFLITLCIPEPSPVPSAPCILLLVVGVDHPVWMSSN